MNKEKVKSFSFVKLLTIIFLLLMTVSVIFAILLQKSNNRVALAENNSVYENDFYGWSTKQTTISAGWQQVDGFTNGTFYEQDGALVIDNSLTYQYALVGYTETSSNNYMVEADLTMIYFQDIYRWMGLFYRQSEESCFNVFNTAVNNIATFGGLYDNGELNPDGQKGWYHEHGGSRPFTSFAEDSPLYDKLYNGETVNLRIIVIGQRVVGYINGIYVLDHVLPFENKFTNGYVGVAVSGAKVKIENFKVTSLDEFITDNGNEVNHGISLPTQSTNMCTANNVPTNYIANVNIGFDSLSTETSSIKLGIATIGSDRVYLEVYKNGMVNIVQDNGMKTMLLSKNITLDDVSNIPILVKYINSVVQISINGEIVGERWLNNSFSNFTFVSSDGNSNLSNLFIYKTIKNQEGIEVIALDVIPYGEIPNWNEYLTVNYVYSDGARETIKFTNDMITGFNSEQCGLQNLTFTYNENNEIKTKVFSVVVHNCGEWEISQYATLTSSAIKRRECLVCGAYEEREYAAYRTIT